MKQIPETHQNLLLDETRAIAFLSTLMPEGSPQVTPVWFNTEGDYLLVNSAKGRVKDGADATIFRLVKRKTLKDVYAKRLFDYIDVNYQTLPFSERWIVDAVPRQNYSTAFQELRSRCLMSYYTFIEVSGSPVAQAEHTVLVEKDGCCILT